MSINFKAPEHIALKPHITVFGIGGAGCNAVNTMINSNLQGAEFVVANTDAQSLEHSLSANKIQLGPKATEGLGAGAAPEIGAESAEESVEEIRNFLEGSHMVFITAGMGGGTGTGAAPIVARIAKELNLLTVGVVTTPFDFEGPYRMKTAKKGLAELQKYVDTLIVIPNQHLFRIATDSTTFPDAFKMADDVLHAGVRGVTDLMMMPGLINLDFADIRTVMSEMGKAMMGTGEATGEDRAIKAAEAAISNPLLDHNSMRGAKGVLINVTSADMTLYEVDAAANRIRHEVGDSEANIIFGATFNPELKGIIRISVVATGIDAEQVMQARATKEAINHDIIEEFIFNTELESDQKNHIFDTLEENYEIPKVNELLEEKNDLSHTTSPVVIQKSDNFDLKEPPKSLLNKLWNSFRMNSDKNLEKESLNQDLTSIKHNLRNLEKSNDSNNVDNNIYDVPTFLRKPKK